MHQLPHRTVTADEQHLNLLAIFHYVLGGMMVLFALMPVVHMVMGAVM